MSNQQTEIMGPRLIPCTTKNEIERFNLQYPRNDASITIELNKAKTLFSIPTSKNMSNQIYRPNETILEMVLRTSPLPPALADIHANILSQVDLALKQGLPHIMEEVEHYKMPSFNIPMLFHIERATQEKPQTSKATVGFDPPKFRMSFKNEIEDQQQQKLALEIQQKEQA